MHNRKKCAKLLAVMLCALSILDGCVVRQSREKVEDLEFTVVGEAEIPDSLMQQVELKKDEAFTMTYSDNEYLYIAKGYGMQETGGYSISVSDCYLSENTICFGTVMNGPAEGESVEKAPSYPYIVIKLELREETVAFL